MSKKEKNIYKSRKELSEKVELADQCLIEVAKNNSIKTDMGEILDFEDYDCPKNTVIHDFYCSNEYIGMLYKKRNNNYKFKPFKNAANLDEIENSSKNIVIQMVNKRLKIT